MTAVLASSQVSTAQAQAQVSAPSGPGVPRVLFVDDDDNLLQGVRRQLRREFDIELAVGPEAGLIAVRERGPFAVVMSDMQMPGMNGVEFFVQLHELDRDAVRIMLTGNVDQKTAADAVNDGHIFRFLNKPCSKHDLTKAINAGFAQYRLVTAERELVSQTLTGSVKVLTDVLALSNPAAFRGLSVVRNYVRSLAAKLKVEDAWQCELSAMLCRLGYVAVPEPILAKAVSGQPLSPQERALWDAHPETARRLIGNIPRLAEIATIVSLQNVDFNPRNTKHSDQEQIPLAARILRVAIDLAASLERGREPSDALLEMVRIPDVYDPAVIAALFDVLELSNERAPVSIPFDELSEGMVFAENVYDVEGVLLIPAKTEATSPLLARLKQYCHHRAVREPIWVVGGFITQS